MLSYAITFLIIAIIAGVLGFGAIAGTAASIAKVLFIIFLVLFSVLYWAYRHRDHLGGGRGYALDPVCGMQVETARAPATAVLGGERIWFCSDRCLVRFEADPVHPSPGEPQPARVSRGRHGRRSIWATSPTDPSVAFGPPGSLGSAHRPHNL